MDSSQNGPPPGPSPSFTSALPAQQTVASSAASQSRHSPAIAASSTPITPKMSSGSVQQPRKSKDSLKNKPTTTTRATSPFPLQEDRVLQILKQEFDSIRALITCSICYDLLFEPYTTSCGHTYCYNCLCKSFVTTRSTNCPECRTVLKTPPSPAYLVRTLTLSFCKHPELLPAGDSLAEYQEKQKKYADEVQRDKTDPRSGGLFKGLFPLRILSAFRPLRDVHDMVDRCPYCIWELEGGVCNNCGFSANRNRNGATSDIASAPSDMDQTSDHLSSEDLDEMEMELELAEREAEISMYDQTDYTEEYDDWVDHEDVFAPGMLEDGVPYMVQRYFGANGHVSARPRGARRAPAAHSAAGSRRRSYTSSIHESEMGTLEEEDEEDMDGDSSMNDFIVDDETASGSQSSASISEHTPVPRSLPSSRYPSEDTTRSNSYQRTNPANRRRQLSSQPSVSPTSPNSVRSRQFVSNRPSVVGGALAPTEGDHEDDQGPIPSGRRLPPSQQSIRQPNRRNRPVVLDEDDEWGPRAIGQRSHMAGVDEGDDDDADSDGTTVGLAQNSNSSRRVQQRGSLTPTADRPQAPIQGVSRTGALGFPLGSRGLRRRSSVLSSASPSIYEDNDADDEDVVQETNISMIQPLLRHRSSVVRIRNNQHNGATRHLIRGQAIDSENRNELDSDDSEASGRMTRPGQSVRRLRQDYDPHISFLFAQHLEDVSQLQQQDTIEELRGITRTPLARPRTSNRNRPVHMVAPQNQILNSSPGISQNYYPNAQVRHRTPLAEPSSSSIYSRPPLERSNASTNRLAANESPRAMIPTRDGPTSPTSRHDALSNHPRTTGFPVAHVHSSFANGAVGEAIERPVSRVSFRSPGTPRRGSGQFISAPYQPGLNPVRAWQNNNNPFLFNTAVRPRVSTQRLREQSSTATLRPRNSIRVLRNQHTVAAQRELQPVPRSQSSRINLRTQASMHRLQSQASSRTLRQVHNPQREPPGIGTAGQIVRTGMPAQNSRPPASTTSTMSEEERQRRAREMVERRSAALRANPFARSQQGSARDSTGSLDSISARSSSAASSVGTPGGAPITANVSSQPPSTARIPPAPSAVESDFSRGSTNRLSSQSPSITGSASTVSTQRTVSNQNRYGNNIASQPSSQPNSTNGRNSATAGPNSRHN